MIFGLAWPTRAHLVHACRLAAAVSVPAAIYFSLSSSVPQSIRNEFNEAATWAGVTVAMCTLPQLGKASVILVERSVATVTAGLLAWALAVACRNAAYLTIATTVLVALGHVVGESSGHSYFGKLFGVTAIMVTTSTETVLYQLPITRVIGVLAGVLISALTSILLLPETASRQVLDKVEEGLRALLAMTEAAWHEYDACYRAVDLRAEGGAAEAGHDVGQPGALAAPTPQSGSWRSASEAPGAALDVEQGPKQQQQQEQLGQPADSAAALDAILDTFWSALRKTTDCLADMREEVYVGQLFGGRFACFLPGGMLCPDRTRCYVPPARVHGVLRAMRRIGRVVFTLHLSLGDGFTQEQLDLLHHVHSRGLLEQLPRLACAAVGECLAAYRGARHSDAAWLRRHARRSAQLSVAGSDKGGEVAPGPEGGSAVAALQEAAAQLIAKSTANRARLLSLAQAAHGDAGSTGEQLQAQTASPPPQTQTQTQHEREQAQQQAPWGTDGGEATPAAERSLGSIELDLLATLSRLSSSACTSAFYGFGAEPGGVPALIRFHSLEGLLEQLAALVSELHSAVLQLGAALP